MHHFVELRVHTMLESDMEHAYLTESNEGMTATDTQKNCVYYVAKQASSEGIAAGKDTCLAQPSRHKLDV